MTQGFFRKAAPVEKRTTSVGGPLRVKDDGTADHEYKYGEQAVGDGYGACTRVPYTNAATGGIVGADNPFGDVVMGKELVNDANGDLVEVVHTPEYLAQFIPSTMQRVAADKGKLQRGPKSADTEDAGFLADAQTGEYDDGEPTEDELALAAAEEEQAQFKAERRAEAMEAVRKQAAAEDALNKLAEEKGSPFPGPVQEDPAVVAMRQMFQTLMSTNQQAPVPAQASIKEAEPVANIRVTFEGAFGKFRGTYSQVVVDKKLLILVHPEDSDVYTPKAGPEVFTIDCQDQSYRVCYMDIEFSLPAFNVGVQVFIRSEE